MSEEMRWFTYNVYDGIEPVESPVKARSESEAVAKLRDYWGPDVILKLVEEDKR
jgi:hypothetical protein